MRFDDFEVHSAARRLGEFDWGEQKRITVNRQWQFPTVVLLRVCQKPVTMSSPPQPAVKCPLSPKYLGRLTSGISRCLAPNTPQTRRTFAPKGQLLAH